MVATVLTFDGVKVTVESVDRPQAVPDVIAPTPFTQPHVVEHKFITSSSWQLKDGSTRPNGYYVYLYDDDTVTCGCPDAQYRNHPCQHIRRSGYL